jgi:hypothetical protein
MNKKVILLSVLFCLLFMSCLNAQKEITKSIKTIYPTKDWVISDFIVTDYGAKAEPGFDNRAAFQAAIDAAYYGGGGVVYIPAGNYEFLSSQTGTNNRVRVRAGAEESIQAFDYQYVLKLPPSVQLRGDWANPELHDGKVLGTILEVRVGKDSPNYDATVSSWWNDSQAANALFTTYTSIADRFIEMNDGTGVTNLSIWYPEQDINDVKPYPWTFFQTRGDCATIENITLVNAYNGFYSAPSELHYVMNSYMTVLNKGIEVHVCTDIGRVENIKINPKYWANSGLPGSPSLETVTAYTRANGTGFQMHRSDWEYVSYLYVSGYKTGMWIGREPGHRQSPNAQFYEVHIDNCGNGLYVESVNPYGLLFSNSSFGADKDGNAVYFFEDFATSTQFNGVDFKGPIVSDGKDGVISFESCTFSDYSDYALRVNNGNILLTQCEFKKPNNHVFIDTNVNLLKSVNSGFSRVLDITNNSTAATVDIKTGDEFAFDPIPKNIKTNIAVHPKPKSNKVLRADLAGATGVDNNDAPTEDVSAELQAALNKMKAAGGGTVYLPGKRYLVNNPIIIPSGVELRGTWDVQHHTMSGGTAIFTTYTGDAEGENGPSLFQLEANSGIRGFNIAQINLASDGNDISNPKRTPFLIQGQGKNVYVININIPYGDKGMDLASYNTSGHYVDFFTGVVARAGIWVGGGAEGGFIRNMQFNPHYGTRLPSYGVRDPQDRTSPRQGTQGYPNISLMRFVQANCSQLKFADVKNQTIFNNFVYGSVYGIHFLKDAITGNYPGEMTVIGHGSDGCTYALFVEDADKNTKIIGINSELVCTQIAGQDVRAYVMMGEEPNTEKVHPDAQLILYNSAFWGSPTVGALINNGTIRYQQANFQSLTARGLNEVVGIDVRGGKAHVYSSYFAQRIPPAVLENSAYAWLRSTGNAIELTNNHYISGLKYKNEGSGRIFGSDVKK